MHTKIPAKARGYLDECGWEFDPGEVERRVSGDDFWKYAAHEVWSHKTHLGWGVVVTEHAPSRQYPEGEPSVTAPCSQRTYVLPLDYSPPSDPVEMGYDAQMFSAVIGLSAALMVLTGRHP